LHHGILAAAACWVKPLFAQERHRLLDGNDNSIGNDDNATLPRPALLGSSDNWEDHASALAGITRQQFADAVGTDFKIVFSDGITAPVWLTLAAVKDLPSTPAINPASFAVAMRQSSVTPVTDGYSLTFLSTAELTQGAYLFEHATLGKFAMFVVPDGQTSYSAVVNRLSGPTIIAVPFQTGAGRNVTGSGNNGATTTIKINAPTAAVTASPATSSEAENPSPRLSGNQGVRRGVLRD
jgi:hypothetical protein